MSFCASERGEGVPAPGRVAATAKADATFRASVRMYAVSAHSWMVPSRVFLLLLTVFSVELVKRQMRGVSASGRALTPAGCVAENMKARPLGRPQKATRTRVDSPGSR